MITRILELKRKEPLIIFKSSTYAKLLTALETPQVRHLEFMFLGSIRKETNKDRDLYFIEDIHIVPQTSNSGAFCETDDERYPTWLHNTFPSVEARKKIRLHGHSHVKMATTPSQVDKEMIKSLLPDYSDFFIQLIVNQNQSIYIALWDKVNNLIYEEIPIYTLIGGNLIKLGEKPKIITLEPIKKEIIEQKENSLNLTPSIKFNLDTISISIEDENLKYENSKIDFITNAKLKTEVSLEITNQLKSNYSYNRIAQGTTFFGGEYLETETASVDYWDEYYKQKGVKKREPKQTPRPIRSTKSKKK